MKLKLITVKDYCKIKKLTDAGVRKQIKTNKLQSLIFDDITYVAIEDTETDKLKNQIKLKNAKISELKALNQKYENQQNVIQEQKEKIEKLEEKLEVQRDDKEKLYEKMIVQYHNLLPSRKQD